MSQKCLQLIDELAGCRLCEKSLPLEPKPIFQLHPKARILIAGQAPGKKAHLAGRPFADASGKRLREWLGIDEASFYQPQNIAILPMGMCYPGKASSGDKAPRKECAATWHASILQSLPNIKLRLIIGKYALAYYLPDEKGSLTEIIQRQTASNSATLVLPHPSPRNNIWLAKNSWFEQSVVGQLQHQIKTILER